jgi:hypothetical protein
MPRLLLPCWTVLSIGCASVDPPPEVRLVRVSIPPPLLVPPPPPPLPARGAALTQGRIGELLLGYDAALGACVAQLDAIARVSAP